MIGLVGRLLVRFASKKKTAQGDAPLLIDLLQPSEGEIVESYPNGLFRCDIRSYNGVNYYDTVPVVGEEDRRRLRRAVARISETLPPEQVTPLTFGRLTEVLGQMASAELSGIRDLGVVKELSRLAAFEAVGLPTIYAISRDRNVQEFYLDSPGSPLYLDHSRYGRCDTRIFLTERERKSLETHMDTFKGYTLDYSNPSLKNEFDVFGTTLRVSLDLSPLAVSGFSMDVRKLTSKTLTLEDLVGLDVLSCEAAAFLLACLEVGLNVTIVGETGSGKTTLLNALDEALDPRLRRVYIEDAVETKELLERGYHQMKLKVDPFERGEDALRTKSAEIIKILHRSPDIVILGEIQSEEHSRAFFQALAAGVRGLQTFHASSPEQAVRRWLELHNVSKANLLDLGVLVQMTRPERLGPRRYAQSISMVFEEGGEPRIRETYVRAQGGVLHRVVPWEQVQIRRPGASREEFLARLEAHIEGFSEDPRARAA
jgi:type IV secretory pathway ATPase VirB11/archaellum biosynthesis ATPase